MVGGLVTVSSSSEEESESFTHDIVDGSPRLTLGLIWTIILRFQVCRLGVCEWYDCAVGLNLLSILAVECEGMLFPLLKV